MAAGQLAGVTNDSNSHVAKCAHSKTHCDDRRCSYVERGGPAF